MSRRQYPRIGSAGHRSGWAKDPKAAPRCCFPGCECRATCQPEIEVNWFRGDDERACPVCKPHSLDPVALLEATATWRAANREKEQQAIARKAAKKASAS